MNEYGRYKSKDTNLDLVDLEDLVKHYAERSPDCASALQVAIADAVVYSQSTDINSCGLSIYYPYYNKTMFQELVKDDHYGFSFSSGYSRFLEQYAVIWLGEELADWAGLERSEESITEDNMMLFTFQLDEDQMDNYASAQLIVLELLGHQYLKTDAYSQVYVTPDVSLDENGVLSAVYTGRTLYCVDEDGTPLTGCLNYSKDGDYIVIPVNYVNTESGMVLYTLFYCIEDGSGDDLEVRTIYVYDEGSMQYTNRLTVDPDEFNEVYFPISYYYPTYDGDVLLPYEKWDKQEEILIAEGVYEEDYSNVLHFRFFNEQPGEEQLYAAFQITDTQANTYCTELTEVINPYLQDLVVEPSELNSDWYQIEASAVVRSSAEGGPLILRMQISNPTDKELEYRLEDFIVNGSRTVKPSQSYGSSVEAGETQDLEITFYGAELTDIERVQSIECTLVVEDGDSYDIIENSSVTFTMDADIFSSSAVSDKETTLAQAEWGELEIQLVSMTEGNNGDLSLNLHLLNHSDEAITFETDHIAVNGYGTDVYSRFSLDAQTDSYVTIEYESDIDYYYLINPQSGRTEYLVRHAMLYIYSVNGVPVYGITILDRSKDKKYLLAVNIESYEADNIEIIAGYFTKLK